MVEVLSAFPARPPTPPKASHSLFKRDAERLPARSEMLDTPGRSPASAAESTILRSNKKVNFSPITSYIKPPTFSHQAAISKNEVRSIPPSNECKPSKSILKATSTVLSADDMAFTEDAEPQSLAVLLESATQQLAGASLSSRVDAYMQLLGAFKAYENDTDHDAMASKVGLLLQFVQRDIGREIGKGDLVEMNLVTNALKLGIYIIWTQNFAPQISDEFKIFIVDHALSVLQEGKLPKSILNHYIHVLYTQNFSPKIMTNSRMTRVLAVLSDITDRVNGNNIISQRLGVYTRLLSQSKTVMASQAPLWIEHLISGLLHPIKDTRSKALTLGNQTCLLLGPNLNISKSILDVFNKELSPDRKLVSEVCDRMCRMMANPESGVHVPQIWSIIVLLLRSKRFNIEHWEYFKEWVLVLQKCFNCSEPAIKSQAIIGWNKFVYVVTCNESTSASMLKMLTKPILSHCERKRSEKAGASMNPLFLSSYFNLLYYSFRPSIAFEHIDVIWEEYISQPFANIFASSPQLNDAACKALAALSWTPHPKGWTDNKINEVSKMEAEFLLPIDCRWIRSRIVPVIRAFEALLASASWQNTTTVWSHICKAIADASSKEIKPSAELMQAVTTILGLFQRLRQALPSSLNSNTNDIFLERFTFLSTTLISTIGPSSFTETFLLKTSQETFQAANTPTHLHSRTHDNIDTPFMHILRMISSIESIHEPTNFPLGLIDSLLDAASKGRQSRGSRLDFLGKCTQVTMTEDEANETAVTSVSYIWEATARSSVYCLTSLPMETLRERDGSISRDYVNVTDILLRGLQFTAAFTTWSALLDAYIRIIRTEKGERGLSSLVIEPLAMRLEKLDSDRVYLPMKALINQALLLAYYQQPNVPTDMNVISHESSSFFPEPLVELINKVMTESYNHFTASNSSALAEVVESLTTLLGSGSLHFRFMLLERLQGPLALWLRDSARCVTAENGADSRLLTACRTLTLAIANALQMAVPHNIASLQTFEAVVSAGLESVHKSTANRFIEMWNSTFGLQESVTYPPGVQAALQKLEPLVELQLPRPLSGHTESQELELPDFVDSQDVSGEMIPDSSKIDLKIANKRLLRPTTFSSSPIIQSTEWDEIPGFLKQSADSTPERRLRHDNSEIQFVRVDSSPRVSNMNDEFLTTHQHTVKTTQRRNTAMFLEGLRSSSPALPDLTEDTGALSPVQLPKIRDAVRDLEGPSTPTLAANLHDIDDEFPGSSPTPATKDQVSLQPQKAPALSIKTVGNLASDPPSSPPEIASRSPRNEEMTLQGSLKATESKIPSNVEPQTKKKQGGRRRSSRLAASKAPEDFVDESQPSGLPPNAAHQETDVVQSVESNVESEPLDAIPDTYTDEFDRQLASQLEQDLELAVDTKRKAKSQSEQSSDVSLRSGPTTRKRKRNAGVEETPTPENVKRRSLRNSKSDSQESVLEASSQSEGDSKTATPRALILRRGISTPQSSPLKHQLSLDELSDKTNSDSRRKSRRLNAVAEREVQSSPSQSEPSAGTRTRRSLRLNGTAAASPPNSDSKAEASKHRKKRSQSNNSSKENFVPSENAADKNHVQDVIMSDGDSAADHATSAEDQVAMVIEATDGTKETSTENAPDAEIQSSKEEQTIETDAVMTEDSPDNAAIQLFGSTQDEPPRYVSQAVQTEDQTNERDNRNETGQPGGILGSLRKVLTDIRNVTFGRGFLREIDDVMFDIRFQAHEAARRNQD